MRCHLPKSKDLIFAVLANNAKNIEISPNFLVWKFLGKAVSAEFWAVRAKLWGNCVFPQTFHTRKLGQISVYYAIPVFSEVTVPCI